MTGIFRNRGTFGPTAGADGRIRPRGSFRLSALGLVGCLAVWPLGAWAEYALRPGDPKSPTDAYPVLMPMRTWNLRRPPRWSHVLLSPAMLSTPSR